MEPYLPYWQQPVHIYIASCSANRVLMRLAEQALGAQLRALGLTPVFLSQWVHENHTGNDDPDLTDRSRIDLDEGIAKAELVVAFAPYGEGSISEIAMAYGAGTPVLLVGPADYPEWHDSALILGRSQPWEFEQGCAMRWCSGVDRLGVACLYQLAYGWGGMTPLQVRNLLTDKGVEHV